MTENSNLKLRVVVDGKEIGHTTFDERDAFLSEHFDEKPNNVHYYVEETPAQTNEI